MDTSDSMGRDWMERTPGTPGYTGPRLNDAKAVISNFVRQYDVAADPDARIAFVTFGGSYKAASQLAPVRVGWSTSGCPDDTVITPTLCTDDMKWAPLQQASNNMATDGLTPGPVAFEAVEALLQNKRTPPAGKTYEQVVIFATDGVFNVCGSPQTVTPPIEQKPCPFGEIVPNDHTSTDTYYYNNPDYTLIPGRPLWQAQVIAKRIKSANIPLFVVALTPRCTPSPGLICFSTKGLPDISSGTGYYFEADDPSVLAGIYQHIANTIIETDCKPGNGEVVAPGTVIHLTQPGNPSFTKTATADSNGRWSFTGLTDGEYIVKADPVTLASQDGKSRTYTELVNKLNPNEEKQATVIINGQNPNGSSTPAAVKLTLPRGADGTYPDGCYH
jgi:hypothetical protein